MTNTVDDILSHFGRKGMKWGVRRSSKELAKGSDGESKPAAPKQTKTKGKSVKDMSDADLKATVSRMQLEKQYSDLSRTPSKMDAGKKFIAGIGANIARTSIQSIGQSYANKAIAGYMAKPARPLPPPKP